MYVCMYVCIAASKYNAHTEPPFKQLNLLKACDICKLQELNFYHKLVNIDSCRNIVNVLYIRLT